MKSVVVALVVVFVLASPAAASAPTLRGLQHQVTALRAQIVALQKAQTVLGGNDQTTRDWATCQHAPSLDVSNQIWHVLNVDLAYQGFQAQPDLPRYDDQGACQRVGQTRIR